MARCRGLAVVLCPILLGCNADEPAVTPAPVTSTPEWEAAAQVGDVGPGYSVGARGFAFRGPTHLAVDAAGNAFLASRLARPAAASGPDVDEGWATVYQVAGGWNAPERITSGTGLATDVPAGVGVTPDGALFGWAAATPGNSQPAHRGVPARLRPALRSPARPAAAGRRAGAAGVLD